MFRLLTCLLLWTSALLAPAQGDTLPLHHSLLSASQVPQAGEEQGFSVAADGDYVVTGSPLDDSGALDSGSAKVYDATSGALLHLIQNPNPAEGGNFGWSVAISGTRVVIGAPQDNTGFAGSGRAYVFDFASVTPTVPVATLHNPTPGAAEGFGNSVAISGTRVIVGAYKDDTGATDAGIAYVYDIASPTLSVPIAELRNPSPTASDQFGYTVAASGTRVAVGAPYDDAGATNNGIVYVYDVVGTTPTVPVATLVNPAPGASDYFGWAVAISGTRIVVGAHLDNTLATNTGSAYVFDLAAGTPTLLVATLNNPAAAAYDSFGFSVGISGTRVVVGASVDDASGSNSGTAYVYNLVGATPTVSIAPIATLNNPTPAASDEFGTSVAISGVRVVVGSPQDDSRAVDAGSAYLFDLASSSSTNASLAFTLNQASPIVEDNFGHAVAISGTRMVVGAPLDDTDAVDAGAAYVYDFASNTPTVPIAILRNPQPAVGDNFGWSVAISGTKVVVGAYKDDTLATDTGSVYVYDLGSGTPTAPIRVLNNPAPAASDWFGYSVAVAGNRVVVGAQRDDAPATNSGAAYVYDLASATPTVPMALNNPFPGESDYFGGSVAISGSRVVVGAELDNTSLTNVGRAFVYDLASGTPTAPIVTLDNPVPGTSDWFGYSVSISGTRVVVGTLNDDTGATNAGRAYVFDLASGTPTAPVATLNNPTPVAYDHFGHTVSISGTQIVVGAYTDDTGAVDAGSAYLYDLTSATPSAPVATINNPLPAADDEFGYAVAIDGQRVIVGARLDDSGVVDQGVAFVFAPLVPTVTTVNAVAVSETTATLRADVNANGANTAARFEYGLTTDYGTQVAATPSAITGTRDTSVSAAISGLLKGRTYHFRAIAGNSEGTTLGEDVTFITLTDPPAALTGAASGISSQGATLNGSVTANGASTSVTFQYGLTTAYGTEVAASPSPVSAAGATPVTATLTGLLKGRTYHFRIKTQNSEGTTLGADVSFTTLAEPPVALTGTAREISQSGATLVGSVNANGALSTVAFEYGLTTDYGMQVVATPSPVSGTDSMAVSAGVSGLMKGSIYHFRIKAQNSEGTVFGADGTFVTSADGPEAVTNAAAGISAQGATLFGMVNASGAAATVTFDYGLTTAYGMQAAATPSSVTGNNNTEVSATVSGLLKGRTYHFRVRAQNIEGTTVGADQTFTTLAASPIALTGIAGSISANGATLSASINANGAPATVTFEYGLTTSYGLRATAVPSPVTGNEATDVSAELIGLLKDSTYHYRVVAQNSAGMAFGDDKTFTTLVAPATVVTGTAGSVSATGATLTGSINPNGSPATFHFEYGLTDKYGSRTPDRAAGLGTMPQDCSEVISGLSNGFTYHFRLVAVNAAGIYEGADSMFTTGTGGSGGPSVTTGGTSGITSSGARLLGSVNPNGSFANAQFEYGLTTAYGSFTETQNVGNGNSNVSISLPAINLPPATLVHYRLTAMNASGSKEVGQDATFTTAAPAPTAITGNPTAVTSSGATLTGTVNANGVPTTAFFQYGLTKAYGKSTVTQEVSGSSTQSVSIPLGELESAKEYHFRLVATNTQGTTEGEDAVFTTANLSPDAVDDFVFISPLRDTVISPLTNDTDPDPGHTAQLVLQSVTQPIGRSGLVQITGNTLTVRGSSAHPEEDSFSYTVIDPAGSMDTATVYVRSFWNYKGDYTGIISAEGVGTTGSIPRLMLSPFGLFTLQLKWGDEDFSNTAQFGADGSVTKVFRNDQSLTIKLTISPENDNIDGVLTDGATAVPFTLVKAAESDQQAQPGRFTSFIEPTLSDPSSTAALLPTGTESEDDGTIFGGDGNVLINVGKPGKRQNARFIGRLPDAEKFSAGSVFTKEGTFPVSARAYKRGRKSLGSVTSNYAYQLIPDDDFPDRFFAAVDWRKEAGTSATYYPQQIERSIVTDSLRYLRDSATGLPFFKPKPPVGGGTRMLVIISGGDLPTPITQEVDYILGRPIVIPNNSDLKLRLTMNPITGTLSGSFMYPETSTRAATKTKFSGVFQLLANEGRAVFRGLERSGKVVVRLKSP